MTGMGKDGAAGALAIKRVDGKTCAQDQATSVIYGMPKAAIDAGGIDEVAAARRHRGLAALHLTPCHDRPRRDQGPRGVTLG